MPAITATPSAAVPRTSAPAPKVARHYFALPTATGAMNDRATLEATHSDGVYAATLKTGVRDYPMFHFAPGNPKFSLTLPDGREVEANLSLGEITVALPDGSHGKRELLPKTFTEALTTDRERAWDAAIAADNALRTAQEKRADERRAFAEGLKEARLEAGRLHLPRAPHHISTHGPYGGHGVDHFDAVYAAHQSAKERGFPRPDYYECGAGSMARWRDQPKWR